MLAHVQNNGTAGDRRRVTQFAEADYLYGAGPLLMRVHHVDWNAPTSYDGEDWYPVEGMEVTADGRDVGNRQALVRGRRLLPPPGARRRPQTGPQAGPRRA